MEHKVDRELGNSYFAFQYLCLILTVVRRELYFQQNSMRTKTSTTF